MSRDGVIRIGRPSDGSRRVQRCGKVPPVQRILHNDARLFRDEERGKIIGMATQRSAKPEPWKHKGPEIGEEAVAAKHHLVKLPAGRQVLVIEDKGRSTRAFRVESLP